jgi:hypothetical protein
MSAFLSVEPASVAAALLDHLDALTEAMASRTFPEALRRELRPTLRRGRQDVAARLDAPLRILVMGDFKRGKSSLVDALVGAAVAPADALPETAVIHVVGYGDVSEAWLSRADGARLRVDPDHLCAAELTETRTQAGDEAWLESRWPIESLRGIQWIDTPGTGDLNNSAETALRGWVVRADLLLVVLGAEAPLSATEVAFLRLCTRSLDAARVIFVLNRCDILATEADLDRVLEKAKERLAPLFAGVQVYPVSARRALSANGTIDQVLAARLDAGFVTLTDLVENARAVRRNQLQVESAVAVALALTDKITQLLESARSIPASQESAEQSISTLELRQAALRDDTARTAAALSNKILELQTTATAAICGLIERLAAHITITASEIAAPRLRRHLQFFVADRLRQGIEVCLADLAARLQSITESPTGATGTPAVPEVAGFAVQAAETCWTREETLNVAMEMVLPGVHALVGLCAQASEARGAESAKAAQEIAAASRGILALKPLMVERLERAWQEIATTLTRAWTDCAAAEDARLEADLRLAQSAAAIEQIEGQVADVPIAAALYDVAEAKVALTHLREFMDFQVTNTSPR